MIVSSVRVETVMLGDGRVSYEVVGPRAVGVIVSVHRRSVFSDYFSRTIHGRAQLYYNDYNLISTIRVFPDDSVRPLRFRSRHR